jgi:hypothetical protein
VLEVAGDRTHVGVDAESRIGKEQPRYDRREDGHDSEVGAELGVPEEPTGVAVHGVPEQREVGSGCHHERDDDPLDHGRERLDRPCFRREPARRHRRQAVGNRVVEVHVRRQPAQVQPVEQDDLDRGDADVELPERPCRLGDARRQFLDARTGRLRLHELGPSDRKLREDGHRQYHDPHPAEPLGELPPQEDRAGVRGKRDVAHHGGPGGRETAHALEEGVHRVGDGPLTGQDVRQGADQRRGEPGQPDHKERFAGVEVRVGVEPLECVSGHKGHHGRHGEGGERSPLGVEDRDGDGKDEGDGQPLDDPSQQREARPPPDPQAHSEERTSSTTAASAKTTM